MMADAKTGAKYAMHHCLVVICDHVMAHDCRGAVANMLVTSCKDNICRIWAETVLPDDGLIDSHQLDASVSSQSAQLLSTQQHKKRFLQRLHHIRSFICCFCTSLQPA